MTAIHTHYVVTFQRNDGKERSFHVWDDEQWRAESEAADRFQENYGYHPGAPIHVVEAM